MYIFSFYKPSLFSGDHPILPDFGHDLTFKNAQPLESVPPGYNRSNFFENLKLQQSRKFRRQQIIAAQADDSQSFVHESFFF